MCFLSKNLTKINTLFWYVVRQRINFWQFLRSVIILEFEQVMHGLYGRWHNQGKDLPSRGVWLCVSGGRGGGGCNTLLLHTLFWNMLVFWQNVSVEFPDPMLSVNLEYFIIKIEMQNSINIQSRRIKLLPSMAAFKEVT